MAPTSPAPKRAPCSRGRIGRAIGIALAAIGLGSVAAAEETAESVPIFVEFATGFDYSRGDFGLARDSSLFYVPLGVTVDRGPFRFGLVVPLLYGDGVTSSSLASAGNPATTESDRVAGLGELRTSASALVEPPIEALPWLQLGGEISWPTRTAEVLGTGDFAFTLQGDLFDEIRLGAAREDPERRAPAITPFATFGRNFYLVGSLRDRFFATLGFAVRATERFSAGVAYDWFQSTSRDLEDAHQIVPYVSVDLSTHWSVGPYGVAGLSEGAPDFGVGFAVRFRP